MSLGLKGLTVFKAHMLLVQYTEHINKPLLLVLLCLAV